MQIKNATKEHIVKLFNYGCEILVNNSAPYKKLKGDHLKVTTELAPFENKVCKVFVAVCFKISFYVR